MSTVKGIERYLLKGRVKIGGKIREPGELVELTEALHAQLLAAGNVGSDPEGLALAKEPAPKTSDDPPPAAKPVPKPKSAPKGKAAKPKAAEPPKEPVPAPEGVAGTDEPNTQGATDTQAE